MARVKVNEFTQGVHDFSIDWWRLLPEEFRKADRAQGAYLAPAWDGLNRDPRFVTGFDSWDRANTSGNNPEIASLSLSRSFEVTPHVPVLVRSWHTPRREDNGVLDSVSVKHVVSDYTGAVVASNTAVIAAERGSVDTWVTPDRFGRIHVTVDVSIKTPFTYDSLNAIHVGTREVDFTELPTLEHFTVHKPYPLLRYMDGIGHEAGFIRNEAKHLWHGDTVNPVTAPDAWLPFLAAMLGLPESYTGRLTTAQLRSHLVAFVERGRPPVSSRRSIAEVAKQWLTGSKSVTVIPANMMPKWPTPEDKALLKAVTGNDAVGRVLVSDGAPVPRNEYVWSGEAHNSVSVKNRGGRLEAENRIPNPSFVSSTSNWVGARCVLDVDKNVIHSHSASMRITPTDAGNWYAITGFLSQPTDSYVRVRFRVLSKVKRDVHAKMWEYDPDNSVTADRTTIPAGEWVTVEGRFLVSANRRHRFALVPASGDDSLEPLWVDDVYAARESYLSATFFDGDTPDSSANDVWVQTGGTALKVYKWDNAKRWVLFTGDASTQAKAVVGATARKDRLHTLLMLVRADELPGRDLQKFETFMQESGIVPAGHRLVCIEARPSWDDWEAAAGDTWDAVEERIYTWTDAESTGITLDF